MNAIVEDFSSNPAGPLITTCRDNDLIANTIFEYIGPDNYKLYLTIVLVCKSWKKLYKR